MADIRTIPFTIEGFMYALDSGYSQKLQELLKDIDLPLKSTDTVLVFNKYRVPYKCDVDTFIEQDYEPFCLSKYKSCRFYTLISREGIDYKITAKDFRLELLRLKGVLK